MNWRTPPIWLLRAFFPDVLWRNEDAKEGVFHLTFDDGPTTFTLDIANALSNANHTATFFLSTERLNEFPELINALHTMGHSVGYHGHTHLDAWKVNDEVYIEDLEKSFSSFRSNLFRPPYGHLRWRQYKALKNRFQLVMWDLMPGDFQADMSAISVSEFLLKNVKEGSVVALHDQEKIGTKSLDSLSMITEGLTKKGLRSEAL
jgi:peptidoglycan/xylan/chitin deacetylase (PgdA/CDA1 family)